MAAHRLAFHYRRPPSELRITLREFLHIQKFLELEPPDEAEDFRTAALMAQITNVAGRKLPSGKHMKPGDFLKKSRPQTAQQQKAFLKSLKGNGNG